MKFSDLDLKAIGHEISLIGGVWAGNDRVYLCVFPEFHVEQPVIPSWIEMGYPEWKALLRQSDIMETEVLKKAEDGKLYKAVARKSQRNIEQGISWRVFKRDGYQCRYCGNDDVPLTVDHVVLWEVGGPSIEENLVSACRKCNKLRGNTPYAEWLESRRYSHFAQGLSPLVRSWNQSLLKTLDDIPIQIHKRSRK